METENLERNPLYIKFEQSASIILKEYVAERRRKQQQDQILFGEEFRDSQVVDPVIEEDVREGGHAEPTPRRREHEEEASEQLLRRLQQRRLASSSPSSRSESEEDVALRSDSESDNHHNTVRSKESQDLQSLSPSLNCGGVRTVLLCVPQALSLRSEPTLQDVRSHILVPVEESAGDFETLDRQVVSFKGSKILVSEDSTAKRTNRYKLWPPWRERSVHILCTEDVKGFSACGEQIVVRALHIDRPLRGGCSSSCTLEGMDLNQIRRYVCLLRALPEHDVLFEELDEFTSLVHNSLTLHGSRSIGAAEEAAAGSRLKKVQRLIRHCIRTTAQTIIRCSGPFTPLVQQAGGDTRGKSFLSGFLTPLLFENTVDLSDQVKRHTVQLEQVIEGYVLSKTHPVLIGHMNHIWKSQDEKLNRICAMLRKDRISQQDLGMRPEFQCSQQKAIAELAKVEENCTALGKLQCFSKTIHLVNTAVEENLLSHVSRDDLSSFQLTTDDLLDQLIFVLIWANENGAKDIVSQIEFVRTFHSMNVNTSSLGYNMANMEVAVQWILINGEGHSPTIARIIRDQVVEWPHSSESAGLPLVRTSSRTSLGNQSWDLDATAYFVLELGQAQELERIHSLSASGLFDRGEFVVEDVTQFACSKFSPDLFCSISTNGRIRVSTGMHHALLSRRRFGRVSVGENHIVAVDEGGAVFAWGSNSDGQLGIGKSQIDHCATPVQLRLTSKGRNLNQLAVEVACGARHSMVLSVRGELWSWGRGRCGRLGHGGEESEYTPRLVESLKSELLQGLAAGWSHSLVVSESDVYSFGCGKDGRLGLGNFADAVHPSKILCPALRLGEVPVQVAAGYAHSAVRTSEGRVFMFGSGAFGQLGFGTGLLPKELRSMAVASTPEETSVSATRSQASPLSPSALLAKIRNLLPLGEENQPGSSTISGNPPLSSPKSPSSTESDLLAATGGATHMPGLVPLEKVETPRRKGFVQQDASSHDLVSNIILRNDFSGGLSLAPQPLKVLSGECVVSIDCGKYHTAVACQSGHVFSWGFDEVNGIIFSEPVEAKGVLRAAQVVACGAHATFLCFDQSASYST